MQRSRAEVLADLIKKKSATMKLDLKVVIVRQPDGGSESDFEVTASFGGSVLLDQLCILSRSGESTSVSVTLEHHLLLRIA
jgi:hypothetical protein